MELVFLSAYIGLILVRPMDWWGPLQGFQLVNWTALATIFSGFAAALHYLQQVWRTLPSLRMFGFWVVAATLSWAPRLWFGGMNMVFQEQGKIFILIFFMYVVGQNTRNFRILLWVLLGSIIFWAIHAEIQIRTGVGFGGMPPLWRPTDRETGEGVWQAQAWGIFEDPNDLCLMFITAIPLLYAEFRVLRFPVMKALALLAIPLAVHAAILTNSRGGFVGVYAMVAAYISVRLKGYKRWVLIAVSVALVTFIAPSRFGGKLTQQQDRSVLWGDGIAMFKTHPLFGVGYYEFGNFSSDHKVAHNTYVHVLAETGIVGYIPFFLMLYFAFVQLRRTMTFKDVIAKHDSIELAAMFSAAVGYFTSLYFLSRQKTHTPYIMAALMVIKAHEVCRRHGLYEKVFRQDKQEFRRAIYWAAGSIPFMWITIRAINATR